MNEIWIEYEDTLINVSKAKCIAMTENKIHIDFGSAEISKNIFYKNSQECVKNFQSIKNKLIGKT